MKIKMQNKISKTDKNPLAVVSVSMSVVAPSLN